MCVLLRIVINLDDIFHFKFCHLLTLIRSDSPTKLLVRMHKSVCVRPRMEMTDQLRLASLFL